MSSEEPITTEEYVSPFAGVVFGPQRRKDKNAAQLLKFLGEIPKLLEAGPFSTFEVISKPIDSHGPELIDVANLHEFPGVPSNRVLLQANKLIGNKEDVSL
ncbi:hypothetical protein BGZ80_008887, partial [Entomortierella chlamydospora]